MTYGNITINTTNLQTYLHLPADIQLGLGLKFDNSTGTVYVDTHTHTATANRAIQLHSVSSKD